MMENKFKLSEKRKKLREDLNYLFKKINWAESFLDAKAITIMNEFMKDINDTDKEFIRLLKKRFTKKSYPNSRKFIDNLLGDLK